MAYWLLKSDPEDYGFAELERDRRTSWDGVTHALALKHLRSMRRGDDCLIYETGNRRAVVGTARVTTAPRPDADEPRLVSVGIAAGRRLPREVTLAEIKAEKVLADCALVRQGRLSVMPLSDAHWRRIVELSGG